MTHVASEGLRDRKRRATRRRIASEAARLVLDQGMAGTTVDEIAAAADVGRASFFRYFGTKEGAVAEGFTGVWLRYITDELDRQPEHLAPLDAVRAAFAQLALGYVELRDLILVQAKLSRSSAVLSAWTLQVYLDYEDAIATIVAPRFSDLELDDPRPRLVGALVMAVIRLALDDWVAADGATDLPALIDHNLRSVSIAPASTAAGPTARPQRRKDST
jgi:AcrR family transcriptional regulator